MQIEEDIERMYNIICSWKVENVWTSWLQKILPRAILIGDNKNQNRVMPAQ